MQTNSNFFQQTKKVFFLAVDSPFTEVQKETGSFNLEEEMLCVQFLLTVRFPEELDQPMICFDKWQAEEVFSIDIARHFLPLSPPLLF